MDNIGNKTGDTELILALASGASVREAAKRAGIGASTAYRRTRDPEFKRRVTEARDQLFDRAVGLLADAAHDAIKTLRELLSSSSPSAQLGAARAILEHGPKLRDQVELENRITALEENHAK